MAKAIESLSEELSSAVETAGSAVVRVEGRRRIPASGVIWSSDGVIVTANHVVRREDKLTIGLADGEKLPAKLVGRDPTTDIAILKVDKKGLSEAAWQGVEGLRVGHLVLALGRPGTEVMATLGIVSSLENGWRTPAGGQLERYLQTDVVMYPGFSGGPLLSASGELLGINSSGLLRGISLTVPTESLKRIVETLLKHGRIRRGYLGVSAQAVRLSAEVRKTVDQETGLLVASVEEKSPAKKGGVLQGDVIVGLNDQVIRHLDDLLGLLAGNLIDQEVGLSVVRGGDVQKLQLVVGERD